MYINLDPRPCGKKTPHEPHSFIRTVDYTPTARASFTEVCPGVEPMVPDPDPGSGESLEEAWEEGFADGAGYTASCCGCTGKGEPPENPYKGR